MLEIKNVYKTYTSNNGVSCRALENVSLKFPSKGLVFILGKSGSGKSTLLNLIGGLDNFDRGEITYNNAKFSSFSKEDFEYYRNECVGFVFQDFCLFNNLTAIENVKLALSLQRENDNEACAEALKQVGASNLINRNINDLTGGQKQRIAIARAIVKKAKIILADEPTGSLDSDSSKDVMDLLAMQAKNSLVIIVTHNKELAYEYAERIIEIQDGFILKDMAVSQDNKDETLDRNMMYSSQLLYLPKTNKLTSDDVNELNTVMQEKRQDYYFLVEQNKERIVSMYPNMKEIFFPTNKQDKYVPYRYVNDSSNDKTFKKENKSMSLSTSLKFGKSLAKRRRGKLFLSIFISIIMIVVMGIITNFANYNLEEAVAISLKNNDSKYLEVSSSFSISDENYKIQDKDLALLDSYGYEYAKKYDIPTALGTTSQVNVSNARKDALFTGAFAGFIETDNLEKYGYKYLYQASEVLDASTKESANKNGINISSVVAGTMVYYNVANSMEELINKQVSLNGHVYKIIGIFDTNYDKYEKIRYAKGEEYTTIHNEYEDIKNDAILRVVVNSDFMASYLDEYTKHVATMAVTTYNINNAAITFNNFYDSSKVKVSSARYFKTGLSDLTINTIADNEIFVGTSSFQNLMGVKFDSNKMDIMNSRIDSFNNANLTLTFKSKATSSLKETYQTIENVKVVGIFTDSIYRSSILTNHDTFVYVTNEYFKPSSIMLEIKDNVSCKKLVDNLYTNGFVIDDESVYYLVELVNMLKQYNVILDIGLIFWIVIVAMLFYSFMSKSIQDNKRQIGILKALGSTGKDIYKIFTYEAILLASIAILGGALIYVAVAYITNYLVTYNLMLAGYYFYYPMFIVNVRTILTMIIPSLLVLVLSLIIPISKANKIKPIEVMNRE